MQINDVRSARKLHDIRIARHEISTRTIKKDVNNLSEKKMPPSDNVSHTT